MAEDIICLLDHIGWMEDRTLNVVGISLGGMIAQGTTTTTAYARTHTNQPFRFFLYV